VSSYDKCPLAPAAAPCFLASASARVQDQSSQERTGPRVPNALSSGVDVSVMESRSLLSTACRLLELAEIMAGSLDGLGYE
jgi:hypothetical protein